MTDIDFADDVSLLAETRDSLQELTTNLETEAKKLGLRISAQKTKTMQIGGEQAMTPLSASQQTIQNVDRFSYLGSILTEDGDVITDDNCRIGKASTVFRHMRSIWSSPVINTNTNI